MAPTEDWAKLVVQNIDTVVQEGYGNVEHQMEDAPYWHKPQIAVGVIHVAGLAHQAKHCEDLAKVDVLVLKGGESHAKRGRVRQSTKNAMNARLVASQ